VFYFSISLQILYVVLIGYSFLEFRMTVFRIADADYLYCLLKYIQFMFMQHYSYMIVFVGKDINCTSYLGM